MHGIRVILIESLLLLCFNLMNSLLLVHPSLSPIGASNYCFCVFDLSLNRSSIGKPHRMVDEHNTAHTPLVFVCQLNRSLFDSK